MTVKACRQGNRAPAWACLRHTRGDSFTKGLTNIREGQGGWEVGREGRGRGQRPRSKGHLASAIAHILWPPARKYSIATGLRSPEASPSQTPEPDGQTDPFPACLPAASLKTNRRRRQKNQKKKKKDKHPPQSRTQVRWGEEWKKLQRSPWKSPHN